MATRRGSLGGWLASLVEGRQQPSMPADFTSAMVESHVDGIVACDADGSIVVINRRAREGSDGLPPRVVVPPSLAPDRWAEYFQLYPPGGGELLATEALPLVRALAGETVRDMLLETGAPDGSRAVVNASAAPVVDSDGAIQGAVVVIQNYTERVAAERRLKLSGAVAANIALGVSMVKAADGSIVYANQQWERLFGYGPGELIGKHISVVNAPTVVSPEQRAEEIFEALDRDGTWGGEFQNVRKDGTLLWTYASISSFDHAEHGVVWITASKDITSRKEHDSERHETAERLGAIFEQAPVGIALIGRDEHLVDANRMLCEMVGWQRDELVGQPLAAIVHPGDHELDAQLAARLFNGEIPRYRIAMRYTTKSGDVLPVVVSCTVLRAPDGRPLSTVAFVSPNQDDAPARHPGDGLS